MRMAKEVTQAAQRCDLHGAAFELLADAVDVDFDGAGIGEIVEAEDAFRQRGLGDGRACLHDQVFEHGMFARRQRQGFARQIELSRPAVEHQVADGDFRSGPVVAAAHGGAYAGFQLGDLEGLGEIIVGAAVEACDAAIEAGIGCQDDDRHLVAALAQALQYRQSVHFRQRQIEDDDGIGRDFQHVLGVLAVIGDVDDILRLTQRLAEPGRQFAVVFDDQEPHGATIQQVPDIASISRDYRGRYSRLAEPQSHLLHLAEIYAARAGRGQIVVSFGNDGEAYVGKLLQAAGILTELLAEMIETDVIGAIDQRHVDPAFGKRAKAIDNWPPRAGEKGKEAKQSAARSRCAPAQDSGEVAHRAFCIDLAAKEPLQRFHLQELPAVGFKRPRREAQGFVDRSAFVPGEAIGVRRHEATASDVVHGRLESEIAAAAAADGKGWQKLACFQQVESFGDVAMLFAGIEHLFRCTGKRGAVADIGGVEAQRGDAVAGKRPRHGNRHAAPAGIPVIGCGQQQCRRARPFALGLAENAEETLAFAETQRRLAKAVADERRSICRFGTDRCGGAGLAGDRPCPFHDPAARRCRHDGDGWVGHQLVIAFIRCLDDIGGQCLEMAGKVGIARAVGPCQHKAVRCADPGKVHQIEFPDGIRNGFRHAQAGNGDAFRPPLRFREPHALVDHLRPDGQLAQMRTP
ncbi:hypothetical protein RHSP_79045 [Rhizobium freirei PRF 81]|uniref:Uncharacterized protein n=1 Tax=Rhizobium freirei PRF 81 TaxID=363754 RepID=N6UTH0_9HYPH|nr:hypothetical protein RHSP_79045 [Rhizobium freirei PRF 81]